MNGTKILWTIILWIVILAYCNQPSESLRILAIFPLNSKSHFGILGQLAKGLAEKGHKIDVYNHFPSEKPIPNYKDYSLAGSMLSPHNNLTYNIIQENQVIGTMMDNIGNKPCEQLSLPIFQELKKKRHRDSPYDVVIVEVFLFNCFLAWGRYLNIPMVGVMSTGMLDWYSKSVGNPYVPSLTASANNNKMNFLERLNDIIFKTIMSQTIQYYIYKQDKYIEQYFGSGYPDPIELQKDLDLLLINSHYSLHGLDANTPMVIPVAGLHIMDDNTRLPQDVQKWLDDSKNGCIYFSFGSMVRIETFPMSIINEIYATFKKISPVRVIWKITKPQELPPGLPSNVMTQSWLSQEQILKHENTKLFITHGGLNGIQESVYFAVPMICIPIFGDQPSNAQLLVEKGISITVPLNNITEMSLTAAIKEILYNSVYKKQSDRLSKLFIDRPMKPLDSAIYWVEYIARHGKRTLRPPIVDMCWWKVNSLDIYAFLLGVFCIILYVFKIILNKIRRLFFTLLKNSKNFIYKKSKKNQ